MRAELAAEREKTAARADRAAYGATLKGQQVELQRVTLAVALT